jgi:hypothetical protein
LIISLVVNSKTMPFIIGVFKRFATPSITNFDHSITMVIAIRAWMGRPRKQGCKKRRDEIKMEFRLHAGHGTILHAIRAKMQTIRGNSRKAGSWCRSAPVWLRKLQRRTFFSAIQNRPTGELKRWYLQMGCQSARQTEGRACQQSKVVLVFFAKRMGTFSRLDVHTKS